jgi:hypothetical protein
LEIVDPQNINIFTSGGLGQCNREIAMYRQRCCDATFDPIDIAIAPTPAPVINLPKGTEPLCDLCPSGKFPDLPKTVAAVLYIPGVNTCERLYYMGLRGLIADRLCNPMQDYLEKDCGCAVATQALAPQTQEFVFDDDDTVNQDTEVELFVRKTKPAVSKEAYKTGGRERGDANGTQRGRRVLKGSR